MNMKLKKCLVKLIDNKKVTWFAGSIINKEFILKNDLPMPTMGTDGLKIYYTESWVDKLDDNELMFSVVHEFYHILFKHPHWVQTLNLNQEVANIAQDIVINAMLIADDIGRAPNGVIRTNVYDTVRMNISGIDFKFEKCSEKNFLEIYKEIMSKIPPPIDGGYKIKMSQNGNKVNPLDKVIPKKLDKEQEEDVDGEVNQLNASAKIKGAGGSLARALDELTQGVVPWKNYIRPVIDRAAAGFPTYSRPKRRMPPTNIIMPSIKRVGINVTVAIDTSGSISNKILSYFLGELDNLFNSYPKNSVTANVLYHTDRVYSIRKDAKFIKSAISKVESGGTDHHEVFEKAEELKSKVLICLTDGYSSYPDTTTIKNVIFICIDKDGIVPDFAKRVDVDVNTIGGN